MIKKTSLFILPFLIFCIFFILQKEANSQTRQTFCDSSNKNWFGANNCLSSCDDLLVTDTYTGGSLSNGSVGLCVGKATKFQINIKKIELGTSSGYNATGNNARCEIFEGTIITELGGKKSNQTLANKPLKFNKCKEVVYDRIYLTIDRKFIFAGNTNYPDNSGKIARTTAACATDNLSVTVTDLSWLDSTSTSNWVNSTLCYGRQSNTWNSSIIKTIKSTLSTTDYSSASNIDNEYDDFKNMYLNSLDPIGGTYTSSSVPNMVPSDTTFYAECCGGGIYNGVKLDPTNSSNEIIVLINGSDTITGSGIGKRFSKKKKQSLEFSYYALSSTKDFGIKFFFRRNGTSAELLGARPDDNGLYITYNQF
jgi:hypothetical protein